MKTSNQKDKTAKLANFEDAAKRIIYVRDYNAEHGTYPEGYLGEDQEFDDWAADIMETCLNYNKP